jgi:hypothetical protein
MTTMPTFGVPQLDRMRPNSSLNDLPTIWAEALYFDGGVHSTPNETNKNIPDLAQLYIVYYPVCEPLTWKAFKGTLSLCLQNLSSTVANSTMRTTILQNTSDVDWQYQFTPNISGSGSFLQSHMFCGRYNDASEDYCIHGQYLNGHGWELARYFNGSASLIPGGDNYLHGDSMVGLVTDVLGTDPTACTTQPGLGFDGFKRRVDNLAAAVTNG